MNIGSKGPQFFHQVCRRYGDVVAAFSHEVQKELGAFWSWVRHHPRRWSLLREPLLPLGWYILLRRDFEKHTPLSAEASGVLDVLHKNGRMGILPSLLAYVAVKKTKTLSLYIYSRTCLKDAEMHALEKRFAHFFKRPIHLIPIQESSVIAGSVVLWNHHMMDASLDPLFVYLKTESTNAICSS